MRSPSFLVGKVKETYEVKVADLPDEVLDQEERRMVLVAIDKQWQAHLYNMDALREGVGLRAQGQKDPLVEYKNEAYNLFVTLMDQIKQEALTNLFRSASNLEDFLKQLHSQPQQLQSDDNGMSRDNMATSGSLENIDPAHIAPSKKPRAQAQPAEAQAQLLYRNRRSQRPLPVRLREKIQAVLRKRSVSVA